MYLCYYFLLILCLFTRNPLLADNQAHKFFYDRDWCYQPIIINGKIIYNDGNIWGHQIISKRYAVIKNVLEPLEGPLKILDIGANNGYFSLKIAEEYPNNNCIMIDGTSRLADICIANTERDNITYLKKYLSIHDLRNIASNDRFDVVLCLFVLHHVDHWFLWLTELKKMSRYIIIEMPPLDDVINTAPNTRALTNYILANEDYEELGRFDRGPNGPKDYLILIKGDSDEPVGNMHLDPKTYLYLKEKEG